MLKLIQLNMEGDKHLKEILPFFKRESPDVLCLQEVSDCTFDLIKRELDMDGAFAPMCSGMTKDGQKGFLGVVILTRLAILDTGFVYYQKRQGELSRDEGQDFEKFHHALLHVRTQKGNEGYLVATTHFPKSEVGREVSAFQKKVFTEFSKALDKFPEIVLTGDTNCPRGTELFDTLARRYKDNIPPSAASTLDRNLHRAGFLPYVIDVLFTSPEYKVKSVRLQDGVSDHMAVVAEITRA